MADDLSAVSETRIQQQQQSEVEGSIADEDGGQQGTGELRSNVSITTQSEKSVSLASSLSEASEETVVYSMDEDSSDIKSQKVVTPTPSQDGCRDTSAPSTPRSSSTTPPLSRAGLRSSSGERPASGAKAKFPLRPGIDWRPGARLEAKDFMEKWYAARLVEIDEEDMTVLIHFEGWNSRYDEWMPMLSDRLRHLTRHSGRKEKKDTQGPRPKATTSTALVPSVKPEHRVGECVFAKWTDCRLYAARIVSINKNGTYEVLFYDGFRKIVQPMNVKTMSQEVQNEYANLGLLPAPLKKSKGKHTSLSGRSRTKERSRSREPVREKDPEEVSPTAPTSGGQTKRKAAAGSVFQAKKARKDSPRSSTESRSENGNRKKERSSPVQELASSPECKVVEPKTEPNPDPGHSDMEVSFQSLETLLSDTAGEPETPDVLPEPPVMEPMPAVKEEKECDVIEVPAEPEPAPASTGLPAKEPVLDTAPSADPEKTLEPQAKCPDSEKVEEKPADTAAPVPADCKTFGFKVEPEPPPEVAIDHEGRIQDKAPTSRRGSRSLVWAPKEFKITDDHNDHKCPFEGCNKGFRKMSLLEYHIKYYHPADGKPTGPPPRKRKKTTSMCSTDSEISVGGGASTSVGGGRRRKRESTASICSLPDVSGDLSLLATDNDSSMPLDTLEDTRMSVASDMDSKEQVSALLQEDTLDVAEQEIGVFGGGNKDEVVNCICQLNEENGLMIQCDVCLCWQHAVCMELTEETLPKKYICYICANSPGVRDSARFMCNQDWHREGTLARFNFLPPTSEQEHARPIINMTHGLVADVLNVSHVLKSLNRELHALKDKNNPEYQMWSKNWDRVMERKKEEREQAMEQNSKFIPEQKPFSNLAKVKLEPGEIKQESDELKPNTGVTFHIGDPSDTINLDFGGEIKREPDVAEQLMIDTCLKTSGPNVDDVHNDSSESTISTDSPPVESSSEQGDKPEMLSEQDVKQRLESRRIHDMSASSSATDLHDYSMIFGRDTMCKMREQKPSGFESADELESDVSVVTVEEDPFANCEKNLLEHIMNSQDRIDERVNHIDAQLTALEAIEESSGGSTADVLAELPGLKKVIHQLMNDLVKVKRMARFH